MIFPWIWERLPGGRFGKPLCSALLIGAVVLLLWFVVFPLVDGLLPFDDVTVDGR
ncbi:hypothetical protein AB0B89_04870 [Sphaerisporangium sp. NPDC049002]|uniref:hypothetical protein n=1 Tax=unclassified Sphaerisporangium TaxID=2630420 RepID=UPI0034029991